MPLLECLSVCEAGSRPAGGIQVEDYGQAISLGGEQIGTDGSLNLDKVPYVSNEFFDSASKGKIKDKDILLCKDGALTGKSCLVDAALLPTAKSMVNEHVYIIRTNDKANQLFLFYIMRTEYFKNQIKDLAFRKKGQPGLNSEHLRSLMIPDVPISIQNKIIIEVEPIISRISDLSESIINLDVIIDNVFEKIFNFDYTHFRELKKKKISKASILNFSKNPDLRFSAKFHREAGCFVMQALTKLTDKKIKDFLAEPIVLGASISPDDYDDCGEYCYISMATIKNWEFDKLAANTVSKSYSDSKKEKTVRKNDIILARSGEGTIGKVALVVEDDIKGVFSDFTMRIRLKNYNPEFAYYYFRTTYFQYLIEIYKKGLGNNTNIFPIAVKEFPLLDIPLKDQEKIVEEIHTEIENQRKIEAQIAILRAQIDDLILKTIR